MPKAKVDQNLCIGCTSCEATCPQVFKMGEDGKSHVIADDCLDCDCQKVVEICPVNAISIEDTE